MHPTGWVVGVTVAFPGFTDFGDHVATPRKGLPARVRGSTSGYVGIKSPAAPTSHDLTLPSALPAANGYVLQGNTDGTTSWVAAGGGGTLDGAACHLTANQSIPHSTWTAMAWDAEDFDNGGLHSNSTNPSRFTVAATGIYAVSIALGFAAGTGLRYVSVYKNGTILAPYMRISCLNDGSADTISFVLIVSLTAGDYVELFAYQSSGGGALNALAAYCYGAVQRVT